jgi:hypothetical protein
MEEEEEKEIEVAQYDEKRERETEKRERERKEREREREKEGGLQKHCISMESGNVVKVDLHESQFSKGIGVRKERIKGII